MPRLLSAGAVAEGLRALKGWKCEGAFLTKTFEFKTFVEAIRFVDRVAEVAEEQEHHPDIGVRYNVVKLSLQTHSEGGVTKWDLDLAKAIDSLA